MAEEVARNGFSVKMVFVGKLEDIEGVNASFPIIRTRGLYENGTLEYLRENLS